MLKKLSLAPSLLAAVGLLILTSALPGAAQATEVRHPTVPHEEGNCLKATGKGWGEVDVNGLSCVEAQKYGFGHGGGPGSGGGSGGSTDNGIQYHGGPLMTSSSVKLYFIWYGDWSSSAPDTKTLLDTFGSSIGGTSYFTINTTYCENPDNNGNCTSTDVSGAVSAPVDLADNYSQGSMLDDSAVQTIVKDAITKNKLAADKDAVYFVLTSKDVKEKSGFCHRYCAWHTHALINGTQVKYGFIGDPEQCPSACSYVNNTTAPNGNLAADSMANLIAHELAESVTDPQLNAWYDSNGLENADKCAWNFGSINKSAGWWNVTFQGKNWLLQQNWINLNGGACTLGYTPTQ